MSNLKKHFFHISKSWFSVCTFIFLLAVCVGLVIHISFGPELHDVHSPNERLSVPSTERTYALLCEILKRSK